MLEHSFIEEKKDQQTQQGLNLTESQNRLIGSESNLIMNKENELLESNKSLTIPPSLQQKRPKADAPRQRQSDAKKAIKFSHNNITGAISELNKDENKKTFGDSTEMLNVKKQLAEVNRIVSGRTIYPCTDLEFEDSINEIKEAYSRLISYAQIYVDQSHPGYEKGKRRLRIVKAALFQAEAEMDLFEYNARKKRDALLAKDDDADVIFDDIMCDLQAQDVNEIKNNYTYYNKNGKTSAHVAASRMYDLLGAKDCIRSAKSSYIKFGKKTTAVVLQKQTPDMNLSLAQVRAQNPGKEILISDNAQKQLNNIKIINFILGFRTEENFVKCQFTEDAGRIKIDRVMAENRGFGNCTASELKTGIRHFLNSIKNSGKTVDEEVINSIISVTAREFSELFGATLKEDDRKKLAERIRVFRNEVKNTGIDKELGLNDRQSTSEIIVSNISEKGFKDMAAEQRRIKKKNKLRTLVQNLRGNNAGLAADDPLNQLFDKIERYAGINVTAVGVRAGRSNESLEREDELIKTILRDAAALKDEYDRQHVDENDPKYKAVDRIFSKFDRNVRGKMPDPPAGSYVMNHIGYEPQFTVDDTGVWFDKTREPLFPHEPTINDVRQGGIGDCFFMGAVCTVVTSYPGLIRKMMKDDGNGNVTVRLFSFEDNTFKPFYIKVKKTVPRRRNRDLYAKDSLWVQMLEKAVVASQITRKFKADFKIDEFFDKDGSTRIPLDYENPKFRKIIGDVKPGEVDKDGVIVTQGQFQTFIGGFGELVIPLLTGKPLKNLKTIDYHLYYEDNVYNRLSQEHRETVDNRAKFLGAAYLNEESKAQIRKHVRFKNDDFDIEKVPEKILNKTLYFQYTGRPRTEKVDEKTRNFAVLFVKKCLRYMDSQVSLGDKNVNPADHYAKLMNSFIRDFPNVKENEKPLFQAFLQTEDFKRVRKYIRNTLKKADVDDVARYTLYSGNYYGKALEVYEKIKQGEQAHVPMVAGGTSFLLNKAPNEFTSGAEGNGKGLYTAHQYTVHGVREKKFGGKTYKFVLVHNPWGEDGTEYYYNPKNKKLARRQVKKVKKTEGYSFVELSDFVMGYGMVYIGNM